MDPIEFIENHKANKKKNRKKFLVRLIITVIIAVIIFFGAKKIFSVPPKMICESNNIKKTAILGGYNWKFIGYEYNNSGISINETDYSDDNILYLNSGDEIYFSNSRRQNIKSINLSYYNIDLGNYVLKSEEINADGNNIFINAPEEIGTYEYNITIVYQNECTVQYAIKVIVKQDSSELRKYENVTNIDDIEQLVKLLPYGKYSGDINMVDTNLVVNYNNINLVNDNVIFNNIVLFTCINNLQKIDYSINNSIVFSVSRENIQNISLLSFDAIDQYVKKRTEINNENQDEDIKKFNGIIQDIKENNIIVKIDENDEASKTTDVVTIPVDNINEFIVEDKVTVKYKGNMLDTVPAQIYLVSIEKISDDDLDLELSSIPAQYTKEQAIEDGYYIYTNTGKEYNDGKFEKFMDKVSNKEEADIRMISFNQNGNLIITDINYVNENFEVCIDLTRDTSVPTEERIYKKSTYKYFDYSDIDKYENETSTLSNVMFLTVHNQDEFYLYQ